MELLTGFNVAVSVLFMVFYSYQILYIFVPFFKKKKTALAPQNKKYAVLVCARNEQNVIGQLIDSINLQDYPKDNIKVFVMADNCTDNTAEVARKFGAVVYERFDKTYVGKGYAMSALLENIKQDYGEMAFDGYFVFDADNILSVDFISRMNDTFCEGYDIVTGYRNSKNWGENWISAGYALWFMRESRFLHLPRNLLGVNAGVSGTGFMFSDKILRDLGGWPFHLLTEDIEFTAYALTNGYSIGYCNDAMFFDEQPVKLSQSCTQRLRWAKGYFQVFAKYGKNLLSGAVKGDFSCYDMMMNLMPAALLTLAGIIINGAACVWGVITGRQLDIIGLGIVLSFYNVYTMFLAIGGVTVVTQWKKIYAPRHKKIIYLFTFPFFMMTYVPISIAALFVDVQWKQISHTDIKNLNAIIGTK